MSSPSELADRAAATHAPGQSTVVGAAVHAPGGSTQTQAFAPGELVGGRYLIERLVGRGGMSEVYRATDRELGLCVALKAVGHQHAQRDRLESRLRREVLLARRISHPNVCRLYDVGTHLREDGAAICFVTMEFLEGETLAELLHRRAPLPLAEALALLVPIAAALDAAHAAGVVHRDLKSLNVMLVPRPGAPPRVVVTDFGLAGALPGDDQVAATTELAGSPAYMAPEQVLGQPTTRTADVYAFGVVAFEMVTGRWPFEGEGALATASMRVRLPAPSPRTFAPGLPVRWERAVLRCLRREPGDRFASAGLAVAALERDAPVLRRRVGAALVIVAALAALGLAVTRARHLPESSAAPAPPARTVCSPEHWCWDGDGRLSVAGIWAAAPDDAWSVGWRGRVQRWDGHTWQRVDSGTVADFFGVSGTASDDVWLAGDWGVMLHWDGHHLERADLPTRALLHAVLALARDDVWAVSSDGLTLHYDGKLWKGVPCPTVADLHVLAARGPDDVFAFGWEGGAVHWDGHAWSVVDLHTHSPLLGATRISDEIWVAGFDGLVKRQAVPGGPWLDVDLPMTPEYRKDFWITSIFASGPDDIWIMSKRETFLHWNGKAWSWSDPGTRIELVVFGGSGSDDLWAAGDLGLMAHWDGKAWTPPEQGPFDFYRGVWAAGPDDVWVSGNATDCVDYKNPEAVVRRFDGHTWRTLDTPGLKGLESIWGSSADDVWLVGFLGSIAHWDGRALQKVASGTEEQLLGVAGRAADDVWAVGRAGTILHYLGTSWVAVASGTSQNLDAVWVARDGHAWAVGKHGTILAWDGQTWQAQGSGTDVELRGVWGSSAHDVWAVGVQGVIVRFDGHAWARVPHDVGTDLSAISGTGPDDVWACSFTFASDHGTFHHWNGQYWTSSTRTPMGFNNGIFAISRDNVWAVGSNETIFHYDPRSK